MNISITIGLCILVCLAPFSRAAECCSPYCPPLPPSTAAQQACEPLLTSFNVLYKGACKQFFGSAFQFTDLGNSIIARDNDPDTICDDLYDPTTVSKNSCLSENGTLEIYVCGCILGVALATDELCSAYFTINKDELTSSGKLLEKYANNLCDNCRPTRAPQLCQEVVNRNMPPPCPNCQSD